MTNTKKVRITFILSSLFITIIALGFNGIINMDSFKKSVTESMVAGYNVTGGEAVRKVEYAVKYGKPLENFYGINDLLKEVKEISTGIDDVQVINTDGKVLYALANETVGTSLDSSLLAKSLFTGDTVKSAYTLKNGSYHLFMKISDRSGAQIGSLVITFGEEIIKEKSDNLRQNSISVVLFFGLIAALVFILYFNRVKLFDDGGEIRRKKITVVIVCVLTTAQLISTFVNIVILRNEYVDMLKANTNLTASIVQKDINQVIEKGVTYEEVYDVEAWMKKIIQNVPQLEKIYISDSDGKVLKSTSNQAAGAVADPQYLYTLTLNKDANSKLCNINVVLSKDYINQKLKDIILDALTLLLTSFFLMLELVLFLIIFLKRKTQKLTVGNEKPKVDGNIIRTLAFLFFIANNIAVSFVPALMKDFYKPLWGLPENVVIALPTTMEMMGTIITTLIAGIIIDRKGWKYPFYIGLGVVGTGMLLCGLAGDQMMFILARFVIGIGYGLCWMAMRGFVAGLPDENSKATGFSSLSAGIYAGINCGCVIGGMLAERIGYSKVFLVGLVMMSFSGVFAITFMRDALPGGLNKTVKVQKQKGQGAMKFFLNGEIASFFLLMIIPTSLFYMFLSYFFPLYAKGIGVSSANTSRAILVYGICIVYLGPILGKYLFSKYNSKKIMFASNIILVAAMLVFALNGGYWFAVISLLLLGIGDSVGSPAQNSYFLSLEASQAQGTGKVLGFYSVIKKVGNMVGPMAFGWATAFGGMQQGVGIIGYFGVAALAIYFIISLIKRKSSNNQVGSGIYTDA